LKLFLYKFNEILMRFQGENPNSMKAKAIGRF